VKLTKFILINFIAIAGKDLLHFPVDRQLATALAPEALGRVRMRLQHAGIAKN
jgi:hypothetical protein